MCVCVGVVDGGGGAMGDNTSGVWLNAGGMTTAGGQQKAPWWAGWCWLCWCWQETGGDGG